MSIVLPKTIQFIITDFDGIITDNCVYVSSSGEMSRKLNFKGVIISDDMVMGGIKKFTPFEACKKAINAGVNMFIYRNSDDSTLGLIQQLVTAVKNGEIDIKLIDESIEYIHVAKKMLLNIN